MGVKNLATCSDGTIVPTLKSGYDMKVRIAKIDAAMARQRAQAQRDGKRLSECANYQKNKVKRAKLYEKARNRRQDYLHKTTRQLADAYDFVGMETLDSKNMMKNHHLAFAIADASWNEFSTFLGYKLKKLGKHLILIDRFVASTQLCSVCDRKTGPKGLAELSVREWDCSYCHAHHDRDVNAAQNMIHIYLTGHKSLVKKHPVECGITLVECVSSARC